MESLTLLSNSFLERNLWVPGVAVAVILFLVGVLINLILRQRDKESKTFDYRVASDLPILSNRPDNDDLKVTYLDEEVRNPRIVRVTFRNTGKQSIKAGEWLHPYMIRLKGSRLLDAIVTDESADDLTKLIVDRNEGWVQLTTGTLNKGATFTVQMIVDGESDTDLTITGDVVDETRPSKVIDSNEERDRRTRIYTALGGSILLLSGWILKLAGATHSVVDTVGNWCLGVGVLALLFVLARWDDTRKKEEPKKD